MADDGLDRRWLGRLRRQLLDWFSIHARTLPWRDDPTPYKVWVSEIMCQQTQVATVLPYFERFLQRYPDVSSLADADDDELMRLWEGLGYYRRAASLKKAAIQIVERHDGTFPTTFDDCLALPGVGRYTAGAILSISLNQRLPILEGNTQRVFSRWIGLKTPPAEPAAQKTLWSFAESMVDKVTTSDRATGPAAINQASMELGALICTPKNPSCLLCPVSKYCAAFESGLQDVIPGKVTKTVYESRDEFAFLIRHDDAGVLVRQTPPGAHSTKGKRFEGLWDVPRIGPPDAVDVDSAVRWLVQQVGPTISQPHETRKIKHGVTKYRITLHVLECDWQSVELPIAKSPSDWRFVDPGQLESLPMHVTGRAITNYESTSR